MQVLLNRVEKISLSTSLDFFRLLGNFYDIISPENADMKKSAVMEAIDTEIQVMSEGTVQQRSCVSNLESLKVLAQNANFLSIKRKGECLTVNF